MKVQISKVSRGREIYSYVAIGATAFGLLSGACVYMLEGTQSGFSLMVSVFCLGVLLFLVQLLLRLRKSGFSYIELNQATNQVEVQLNGLLKILIYVDEVQSLYLEYPDETILVRLKYTRFKDRTQRELTFTIEEEDEKEMLWLKDKLHPKRRGKVELW